MIESKFFQLDKKNFYSLFDTLSVRKPLYNYLCSSIIFLFQHMFISNYLFYKRSRIITPLILKY